MDIGLPDTDGCNVTRKIRAYEQEHDKRPTPIVALTANVMRGDREKSLNAGCDGYIQKPIDIDHLPKQIRSFLK